MTLPAGTPLIERSKKVIFLSVVVDSLICTLYSQIFIKGFALNILNPEYYVIYVSNIRTGSLAAAARKARKARCAHMTWKYSHVSPHFRFTFG